MMWVAGTVAPRCQAATEEEAAILGAARAQAADGADEKAYAGEYAGTPAAH